MMGKHWLCELLGHKFKYLKPWFICERCGYHFHNPYPPQGNIPPPFTIDHNVLLNVTANQHHNEDHEARHILGGADAIDSALDARAIALANQGDIPYRAAAANTLTPLAPGVAGQALLTGGAGANPYWGTVADTRSRTIVVAASNSIDPTLAPAAYRCTGAADQVEINAAITALGAIGGTVILLEGTYNTTAPITITRDNVNLIGCGWGTIIDVAGAGVNAILIGDGVNHYENIVVQDLQIDGTDTTGASRGVYANGATGVEITCVTVLRCWAHHFSDAGSYGIHLYYTDKSNVTLNRVNNNASGIYMHRSDSGKVQSNTVEDNPHPNNGILSGVSNYNIISGNHCSGNGNGIRLYNAVENVVNGNHCYDNTTDGIELAGTSNNNEICGNQCDDNGGFGIFISEVPCNNNRVMENRLPGNTSGPLGDSGTGTMLPEIMVPILDDSDTNASLSNIGDHLSIAMADTFDVTVRFGFRVPSNFHGLQKARIVVVPLGTGNMRWGVETDWGACGEVYNTGSGSRAAGETAVTLNEMECVAYNLNTAFTGIAAEDHVGVAFTRYGSDDLDTVGAAVHAIMFWMQYV